MAKSNLQSSNTLDIIPTVDEKRIIQNLRKMAERWAHGRFGPVTFHTHNGKIQYGVLRESENIETRI